MITSDAKTTIFAFPGDVLSEGADRAIDRIAEAGLGGVSLAALYHDGRDLLPHNPRVRVKFQPDGVAQYVLRSSEKSTASIQPIQLESSATTDGTGPMEKVLAAVRRRGLSATAWAVFLHNTSLGRRNPEAVTRNVFGDPQFTSLCPANPAAIDYSLGIAKSMAGLGVDAVNAEGLHFLPFEHGYHHERYFIRIGPIDRLLFGLCFCDYCVAAGSSHGVNMVSLRSEVSSRLERVLETANSFDPTDDTPRVVDSMWDGELGEFLRSRERSVSNLVRQVHEALLERSTEFIFNDPAGALRQPAEIEFDESWRLGISPSTLAGSCDEVQMLAYSDSAEIVAKDVAAYRARLGPDVPLRVALRPMWPDCDSTTDLTQKLNTLRAEAVEAVDFYAYDFMRLEELERVRTSLLATGWADNRSGDETEKASK